MTFEWHRLCRQILVFLCLLGFLLLSLFPIWSQFGIVPNFMSIFIYLWTIYRPDLLSLRLYVLLGVIRDGMFGYPLGLSIIEIVLIVSITNLLRRYVIDRAYWIVYVGYGIFTFLSSTVLWAVLSAVKGTILPFSVVFSSSGFNILCYPFFSLVSILIQRRIEAFPKTV